MYIPVLRFTPLHNTEMFNVLTPFSYGTEFMLFTELRQTCIEVSVFRRSKIVEK